MAQQCASSGTDFADDGDSARRTGDCFIQPASQRRELLAATDESLDLDWTRWPSTGLGSGDGRSVAATAADPDASGAGRPRDGAYVLAVNGR